MPPYNYGMHDNPNRRCVFTSQARTGFTFCLQTDYAAAAVTGDPVLVAVAVCVRVAEFENILLVAEPPTLIDWLIIAKFTAVEPRATAVCPAFRFVRTFIRSFLTDG
jgi:hypothetical protein